MKFGKLFDCYQIPEWHDHYLNYRDCKKLIKEINIVQSNLFEEKYKISDDSSKSLPPIKRRDSRIDIEDCFLGNNNVSHRIGMFVTELEKESRDINTFFISQFENYNSRLAKLFQSSQFNDILPLISSSSLNIKIAKVAELTGNQGIYEETFETAGNTDIPSLIDYDVNNKSDQFSLDTGDTQISAMLLQNNLELLDEIDEVLNFLFDLRINYRNLKLFGDMNVRALYKIVKKFKKKTGAKFQTLAEIDDYLLNTSPLVSILDCINSIAHEFKSIVSTIPSAPTNYDILTIGDQYIMSHNKLLGTVHGHKTLQEITADTRTVYELIERDEETLTFIHLLQIFGDPDYIPVRAQINLLNLAAFAKSFSCIERVFQDFPHIWNQSKLNSRNFFHYHVLTTAKIIENIEGKNFITDKSSEIKSNDTLVEKGSPSLDLDELTIGLNYILSHMPMEHRNCLIQRDIYKRTPLHYAARLGLGKTVEILIAYMKDWGLWDSNVSILNDDTWGDYENMTPLHLAISNRHLSTVKLLLKHVIFDGICSNILLLTIRLGFADVLETLLSEKGFDINYQSKETGQSALYTACKLNMQKSVEILLEQGADTEISENSFKWTPMFISVIEGYENIIKILLKHKALYDISDCNGWTPMEHAALRGYMKIADLIRIKNNSNITNPKVNESDHLAINKIASSEELDDKTDELTLKEQNKKSITKFISHKALDIKAPKCDIMESVTSIGEKRLDEHVNEIIITLGSPYMNNTKPIIKFFDTSRKKALFDDVDMDLSLIITCQSSLSDKKCIIDLPLDDSSDLIKFKVPENKNGNYQILFDLVPVCNTVSTESLKYHDSIANEVLPCIGRGTALLNSITQQVGKNMQSLEKSITIPITRPTDLDIVGTVTFEYMIIKPFNESYISSELESKYWKSLVSTRVIGHRGLGKNVDNKRSLQLGENTLESFIAAASLGASYVEFDVQLTKDNIPVVYHDFLIGETGVDVPMHELTCEQFLELNKANKIPGTGSSKPRRLSLDGTSSSLSRIQTWNSGNDKFSKSKYEKIFGMDIMQERMKLTKSFQKYNYKGNARGHTISSSFVTLKELFKKIPKSVGFNIEMKYPMLDEAEDEGAGVIFHEMNHWVDTILKVIFDEIDGRDIIFSSFHPDICIMLSLKQSAIPILFLTEGGSTRMEDFRASSLHNAIKFAKTWKLLGIVSAAEPILKAPRLVQIIKSSGLVCVTYGVENNDPENVDIEMDAGVDAVIVDNVLAIRKGLTKNLIEK